MAKTIGGNEEIKGLKKLLAKINIVFLETLYRIHLHIRYGHDKVYARGGWYKNYSDRAISQTVHKVGMATFVVSFIAFYAMQSLWPYLFTLKPQNVQAGTNSVTWTTKGDFESNRVLGPDFIKGTGDDNTAGTATTRTTVTVSGGAASEDANVTATADTEEYVAIDAGGAHTLGIKTDGTLWAWGLNSSGQLGDGTTTQRTSPVQIGSATNWKTITAGNSYSLGIKTDGTLWAWGNNANGRLGDGTTTQRTSPVQIGSATWKKVFAGYQHTLGIKTDGTLWAWGYGTNGAIGDGASVDRTSPVQVGSATWSTIATGSDHSLGIKADGTLWAWGNNFYYQLGIGNNTNKTTPVQVGVATNWKSVDAAYYHNSAVRTDGTLWAWGNNGNGQLGDGTLTTRSAPVQIGSATNWKLVTAGYYHSLGVRTDGTFWSWGQNGNGQLGLGSTTDGTSPVQVGVGIGWKYFSGGNAYSVGVKTDGTLWGTGINTNGQLGDGSTSQYLSPTQSGSETTWRGLFSPIQSPGTITGLKINAGTGQKAKWSTVSWAGTTPANTSIKFRTKGADTEAGLVGAAWSDYYTISGTAVSTSTSQWLEAEATLTTTDGLNTPTLNDFTVTYDTLEAPSNSNATLYKADGSTKLKDSTGADKNAGVAGGFTNENGAKVAVTGLTCTGCGTSTNIRPQIEVKQLGTAFSDSAVVGTNPLTNILEDGLTATKGDGDNTVNGTIYITGLSAGDYHFRIRATDDQGRVSGWTSYGANEESVADFSVEQTPPTISAFSVSDATEARTDFTDSNLVTLSISASDTGGSSLSQMSFSNNGSTWSDWETYATTKTGWDITAYGGSAGDGAKNVHFRVKDNAGNIAFKGTSTIQTTDADFNAGTKSNVWVNSNSAKMLKRDGATAGSASECASGYLSGGICSQSSSWLIGVVGTPLEGKYVYSSNSTGFFTWGPSSNCVGPECVLGADSLYPTEYALSADNSINFSSYQARNDCKAKGGRLPNMQELSSMYTYKASYNNIPSAYYWSSVELSATNARGVYLQTGGSINLSKTSQATVRCVKDANSLADAIFTSQVIDFSSEKQLANIYWGETLASGTSIAMEVKAGNTPTPDSSWTNSNSWTTVTKGSEITSLGSKRYVQYKATLNGQTSSPYNVPSLDDVTIYTATPSTITLDTTAPTATDAATIVAPDGGESWPGGSSKVIKWDTTKIADSGIGLKGTSTPDGSASIIIEYTTSTNPNSNPDSGDWTIIGNSSAVNLNNGVNSSCDPGDTTGCYTWRVDNISFTTVKVRIRAVDQLGNTSADGDRSNTTFSILSDSAGPAWATSTLAFSPTYTSGVQYINATPTIQWTGATDEEGGSGVNEYRVLSRQGAEAFADRAAGISGNATTYNILVGQAFTEGVWDIKMRVYDGAGNFTDSTPYTVTVDATGPVLSSFVIKSDDSATNSQVTSVTYDATDGLSGIDKHLTYNTTRNDNDCNDPTLPSYENYTGATFAWDLSADVLGSGAYTSEGTMRTCGKLKDKVGNVSSLGTDTIIYDQTTPDALTPTTVVVENVGEPDPTAVKPSTFSGGQFVGTNTLKVSWSAGTDKPTVAGGVDANAGIQGYNLFRAETVGGTYTMVNDDGLITGLYHYDNARLDGHTYYYKLKAVDNAGNGSGSSGLPAGSLSKNLGDITNPQAVSTFTAAGSDSTTVLLSWNSALDNSYARNGKAENYVIERTGSFTSEAAPENPGTGYVNIATVNFEQNDNGATFSGDTYTFSNTVLAEKWYWYRIKAKDSVGTPNESDWTYYVARGNFAPVFNANSISLSVNNSRTSDTVLPGDIVTISFQVTDADGAADLDSGEALQKVKVADALGTESTPTQVTAKSTEGVTNGYNYTFPYTVPAATPYGTQTITIQVKDKPAVEGSSHDISRTKTFKVIPHKPTAVITTASNSTTIAVAWTAPGSVENRAGFKANQIYSIKRAPSQNGTYENVGYSNTTTFSNEGLTPDTAYYYKVSAFNISDTEGFESDVSASTGVTTPTPAVPLASSVKIIDASTVDESKNRFALVWEPPVADAGNNTTTSGMTNPVTYVIDKTENCTNPDRTACVYGTSVETTNKYYVDVDLNSTKNYIYRIRVKDSFDKYSKNSLSPIKEGQPGAKPSVTVTKEEAGVSTAKIEWTATQEAETQLIYDTDLAKLNDSTAETKTAGKGGRRTAGNQHSVDITGLDPGKTYYYKIVSQNILGFNNDFTPRSFKTTEFKIENTASDTTTTTATIKWTTSIDSDSNVEYQKQTGLGASEDSQTAGEPALTKNHEVIIKGLKPDTNYTYKIRSVTSDKYVAETQFLDFKTKPYDASQFVIAPNASSVAEQNITATSAKITWNTAVATTTWLDYGTAPGQYSQSAGNDNYNTVHVIELLNLTPGTTYYYRVRGEDTNEIEYNSNEYSFSAVLKPEITNIKISAITPYSATLTFDTNVDATVFTAIGKDASYGGGVGKNEFARNHSILLENLEDASTYHYQISVKDKLSNEAKSADATFVTPLDTTGPVVKEVKIDLLPMGTDDETSSAIISWTTDKPATTQIEYDEGIVGNNYSQFTVPDTSLNRAHTVIVKDLTPGTTYRFRVIAKDKKENLTKSQAYNFVTPTKEKSILQLIIRSLEETFSWVKDVGAKVGETRTKIFGGN